MRSRRELGRPGRSAISAPIVLAFLFGIILGGTFAGSLAVSNGPVVASVVAGLEAGLTGVIGIMALVIAYRQWRNDSVRLRYELYERRHEIYQALMNFLETVFREGKVDLQDLRHFYRETSDAYFLCGDEIAQYLRQVYERSVKLNHLKMKAEHVRDEGDAAVASKIYEDAQGHLLWLTEQIEDSKRLFAEVLLLHSKE